MPNLIEGCLTDIGSQMSNSSGIAVAFLEAQKDAKHLVSH
jgi:hypothetical protein